MNDERTQRLRRLSKGIQEKTISDADILATAMDARLAKRKTLESTQNEVNNLFLTCNSLIIIHATS